MRGQWAVLLILFFLGQQGQSVQKTIGRIWLVFPPPQFPSPRNSHTTFLHGLTEQGDQKERWLAPQDDRPRGLCWGDEELDEHMIDP